MSTTNPTLDLQAAHDAPRYYAQALQLGASEDDVSIGVCHQMRVPDPNDPQVEVDLLIPRAYVILSRRHALELSERLVALAGSRPGDESK